MTVTKKDLIIKKSNKKQTEKPKTQTPKTVPDKTFRNDQCRYCKETGRMMTDCAKLTKRRKLEVDPDAEKCRDCNTPGPEEETATLVLTWKTAHPRGL